VAVIDATHWSLRSTPDLGLESVGEGPRPAPNPALFSFQKRPKDSKQKEIFERLAV
jgi:hypothetical protein